METDLNVDPPNSTSRLIERLSGFKLALLWHDARLKSNLAPCHRFYHRARVIPASHVTKIIHKYYINAPRNYQWITNGRFRLLGKFLAQVT